MTWYLTIIYRGSEIATGYQFYGSPFDPIAANCMGVLEPMDNTEPLPDGAQQTTLTSDDGVVHQVICETVGPQGTGSGRTGRYRYI
jgi:hypothetical protein